MSRVSCRSSVEKAIAMFASRDAMGLPPKKVLRTSSELLDFGRDDFRRLRGQGQEREEIASSCRVRSESAFEASKGVFVLEQGDHHALCSRVLTLAEPGIAATRRRPDGVGMASEDSESLGLLALSETETGESKEHGGASAWIRIELPETGNFIFARSRRALRVQPEEHRRRPAEVREVRLRQGLLRPTRPRKLSDPRLRLPEVRPRRGPRRSGLVRLPDREGRVGRRMRLEDDVHV